jgi:hypothetical protein
MDDHRITLSLEGMPENGGAVRLADLVHELQVVYAMLRGLDRAFSRGGQASTEFSVTDLKRVNPSQVVIKSTPREGAPDVRVLMFEKTLSTMSRLEEGARDHFDLDFLEDIKQVSDPVGKRLRSASLDWNDKAMRFTPQIAATIDEILRPQYVAVGFMQGRMEAVNIHAGANTFKIFPRVGPASVICHFPSEMRAQLGAALGRDVVVRGLMSYRSDAPFVHSIQVHSWEVFPQEQPPSFSDLLGIAPNLTEGLGSEEWLERNRSKSEAALRALIGR